MPACSKTRNTGTPRNTPEHSGTPWNTGTLRYTLDVTQNLQFGNPRPKNQLKAWVGLGLAKLRVLGSRVFRSVPVFRGVLVFWSFPECSGVFRGVPVFLVLVRAEYAFQELGLPQ